VTFILAFLSSFSSSFSVLTVFGIYGHEELKRTMKTAMWAKLGGVQGRKGKTYCERYGAIPCNANMVM
jgi:hypothetical protein